MGRIELQYIDIGHQCKYLGYKVLLLNGNMKNRRDVCMACDTGDTTYESLPGTVKTGCMNSPELGACHCLLTHLLEMKIRTLLNVCSESHDKVVL